MWLIRHIRQESQKLLKTDFNILIWVVVKWRQAQQNAAACSNASLLIIRFDHLEPSRGRRWKLAFYVNAASVIAFQTVSFCNASRCSASIGWMVFGPGCRWVENDSLNWTKMNTRVLKLPLLKNEKALISAARTRYYFIDWSAIEPRTLWNFFKVAYFSQGDLEKGWQCLYEIGILMTLKVDSVWNGMGQFHYYKISKTLES